MIVGEVLMGVFEGFDRVFDRVFEGILVFIFPERLRLELLTHGHSFLCAR